MSSLKLVLIINFIFFVSALLVQSFFIAFVITSIAIFILFFLLRRIKIIDPNYSFKKKYSITNMHYLTLILGLIIFIFLEEPIGTNASLFTSFFIFVHLNKLPNRIAFFLALVLLTVTAFFIAARNNIAAEISATITYYFLFVGVMWFFVELGIQKLERLYNYQHPHDKKD